jgi:hypothetical protein
MTTLIIVFISVTFGYIYRASFWMTTYIERRIKLDALNGIKQAEVGEIYVVHAMTTTIPFKLIIFQSLCDACGIALAALTVDSVGRRRAVQLSFLGGCLSLWLLTVVVGEEAIMLLAGFMQFSQAVCWVVVVLFTAESFPTTVRTTGMGFASTFARVGAIGAPMICGYLIQEQIHAAMWFCSGLFFVGFLVSLLLSSDRTGMKMLA